LDVGTTADAVRLTDDTFYCGDEVTEFSYGGCHINCKSCVETYVRRGVTRGPMYNYDLGTTPGGIYEYGNSNYCYDCYDG